MLNTFFFFLIDAVADLIFFCQMPHYFYPATLGFVFNPQLNPKCDQFIEQSFWIMVDGKHCTASTLVMCGHLTGSWIKYSTACGLL